jgi:hypothetical protein
VIAGRFLSFGESFSPFCGPPQVEPLYNVVHRLLEVVSRRNGIVMDLDLIFEPFRGRIVVLDVASPFVYIGTLVTWDPLYLHLEDADVHDLRDTKTTREVYVVDAKRLGVNSNRKRAMVRTADVVSVSALEDILS